MNEIIDKIIMDALKEDIPTIDITSDNIFIKNDIKEANFIAKEEGIISGMKVAKRVFELLDEKIEFNIIKDDSSKVLVGDIIAVVKGSYKSILKAERTALNILQRMSGIATTTNSYVNEVVGNTKILDTRKTTPNLRILEKLAVVHGGGTNHRFSLSDQVMLKDNHIKAVGSITKAVKMVKEKIANNILIEVEVESLEQFKEALNTQCDIIMLDNMSNELMLQCVKENKGIKKLEASGNMTLKRIKEVSNLGVDFISVGALTHSVKSLDISLRII